MLEIERSDIGCRRVMVEVMDWHHLVRLHGTVASRAFEDLIGPELQAWKIPALDIERCENQWSARLPAASPLHALEPLMAQAMVEASFMVSAVVIGGITIRPRIAVKVGQSGRTSLIGRTLARPHESWPGMHDQAAAADLLESMSQSRIYLAFQEVSAIGRGKALYHEVLLRMVDAEGPAARSAPAGIGALERVGLAFRLDYSVLHSVCALLAEHPALMLGCNVSASSLGSNAWWELFLRLLKRDSSLAARLVIEVTETAAMPDQAAACRLLQRLREAGCRIAIDDFGAGLTAMAFVMAVRPDIIKVDLSLVIAARGQAACRQFLKHLVTACQALDGCIVIAEGIETQEDLETALGVGFQGAQGFLLHEPTTRMAWTPQPYALRDAFAPLARQRQG